MQIDLVDDRNDFQAVIDREIRVGEGLRFYALRSIDYEQRAFARGQRKSTGSVIPTGSVAIQ